MTFAEKIKNHFSSIQIKLSDIPSKKDLHLFADYIELVSLFSSNNIISSNDILDRLKDEGMFNQSFNGENQAESNDENEAFLISIFEVVNFRANYFLESYPFILISSNKIQLNNNNLTEKQKLYIFLLLSSNLNVFIRFMPELTKEFEFLSAEVLKKYLPHFAIIKSIGENTEYVGTAIEKIAQLAKEIKIKTNEDEFNSTNIAGNKERGLDIVGWLPFKDSVSNFTIFMGQCACGKKWFAKISESKRYEKYFHFNSTKPIHTMFIPYSLLHPTKNNFFKSDEIAKSLIFERSRLINCLDNLDFFQKFESYTLVDKCISFEEDIV